MRFVKFFIVFFLLGLSFGFAKEGWQLDLGKGSGSVEFLAVGKPSFIKIRGRGENPQGVLVATQSGISGVVSFNLDSLDTGINLRNEHMKQKYLETPKFPKAELTITKMTLPPSFWSLDVVSLENISYEASLSLHGVKKTVNGMAQVERQKNTLDVKSDFKLKLKDFEINTPSFKGITVAEDVDVHIAFSAPLLIKQQ